MEGNDKEINAEMEKSGKVRHLEIPRIKRQRNYESAICASLVQI